MQRNDAHTGHAFPISPNHGLDTDPHLTTVSRNIHQLERTQQEDVFNEKRLMHEDGDRQRYRGHEQAKPSQAAHSKNPPITARSSKTRISSPEQRKRHKLEAVSRTSQPQPHTHTHKAGQRGRQTGRLHQAQRTRDHHAIPARPEPTPHLPKDNAGNPNQELHATPRTTIHPSNCKEIHLSQEHSTTSTSRPPSFGPIHRVDDRQNQLARQIECTIANESFLYAESTSLAREHRHRRLPIGYRPHAFHSIHIQSPEARYSNFHPEIQNSPRHSRTARRRTDAHGRSKGHDRQSAKNWVENDCTAGRTRKGLCSRGRQEEPQDRRPKELLPSSGGFMMHGLGC